MNVLLALCLLALQPVALRGHSVEARVPTPSPPSSESESDSWESQEAPAPADDEADPSQRNNIAELLLPLIERGLSAEGRPLHTKKVIQVLPIRPSKEHRGTWPRINPRKKHVVEITPLRGKGRNGKPLAYILSPAKTDRRPYAKRTDRHHADHEHKDHSASQFRRIKGTSTSHSNDEPSQEDAQSASAEDEQATQNSQAPNKASDNKLSDSTSEEDSASSSAVTPNSDSEYDDGYGPSSAHKHDTSKSATSVYSTDASSSIQRTEADRANDFNAALISELYNERRTSKSKSRLLSSSGGSYEGSADMNASAQNEATASRDGSDDSQQSEGKSDSQNDYQADVSTRRPETSSAETRSSIEKEDEKGEENDNENKSEDTKLLVGGQTNKGIDDEKHSKHLEVEPQEGDKHALPSDEKITSRSLDESLALAGKTEGDKQIADDSHDALSKNNAEGSLYKNDYDKESQLDSIYTQDETPQRKYGESEGAVHHATGEATSSDQAQREQGENGHADVNETEHKDESSRENGSHFKIHHERKHYAHESEYYRTEQNYFGRNADNTQQKIVKQSNNQPEQEPHLAGSHKPKFIDENQAENAHGSLSRSSNQKPTDELSAEKQDQSEPQVLADAISEGESMKTQQESNDKNSEPEESKEHHKHKNEDLGEKSNTKENNTQFVNPGDDQNGRPTPRKSTGDESTTYAPKHDEEEEEPVKSNDEEEQSTAKGDQSTTEGAPESEKHTEKTSDVQNQPDTEKQSEHEHAAEDKINKKTGPNSDNLPEKILDNEYPIEGKSGEQPEDDSGHREHTLGKKQQQTPDAEKRTSERPEEEKSVSDTSPPVKQTPVLQGELVQIKTLLRELQQPSSSPVYRHKDIVITQQDGLNKLWEPRSRDIIELIQASGEAERTPSPRCASGAGGERVHTSQHKSYRLSFLFNK